MGENINVEDLYDMAVAAIAEVKKDDIFIVRDLFRGIDWRYLPQGKRIALGSMILSYAESEEGKKILQKLDKTPQGQQKYRKLSGRV